MQACLTWSPVSQKYPCLTQIQGNKRKKKKKKTTKKLCITVNSSKINEMSSYFDCSRKKNVI